MEINGYDRKKTGSLGERVVAEYLRRLGHQIIATNVARKTGELDVLAEKDGVLHFVEVKAIQCDEFPQADWQDRYDPGQNLHGNKIRKVARTAEWYVAETNWEGEWQVDGALVWLRRRDGRARISYYPQIL